MRVGFALDFKQNKPYKKAKHGPTVMFGPGNSAKSKNQTFWSHTYNFVIFFNFFILFYFSLDSGATRRSTGDDWQSKFSNSLQQFSTTPGANQEGRQ